MKTPKWLDKFLRNKFLHGFAALMTVLTTVIALATPLLQLSTPYSILVFTIASNCAAVFIATVVYSLKFRGDIHRLTEQWRSYVRKISGFKIVQRLFTG